MAIINKNFKFVLSRQPAQIIPQMLDVAYGTFIEMILGFLSLWLIPDARSPSSVRGIIQINFEFLELANKALEIDWEKYR